MIPEHMLDLITQRHTAIVAIARRSGGPQLSPVWFLWDGEAFWFRVGRTTAKYHNIRRSPAISLFVTDSSGFRYLVVYGQAEIVEANPRAIAMRIVEKYYAPAQVARHLPPDEEPDVVTVRVRPEHVVAVIEEIAREAVSTWESAP